MIICIGSEILYKISYFLSMIAFFNFLLFFGPKEIELVTWGVTNRDVLLLATILYIKNQKSDIVQCVLNRVGLLHTSLFFNSQVIIITQPTAIWRKTDVMHNVEVKPIQNWMKTFLKEHSNFLCICVFTRFSIL